MKILVTGVGGQLGHDVMNELHKRGIEGIGTDVYSERPVSDGSAVDDMPYRSCDITDESSVTALIEDCGVDAVIHCAAFTAVDKAEEAEELCRKINAIGTKNLASVCADKDIPMMYFSTDYVFDGQGERPWEPDDSYNPLGVYGKTKAEGEVFVKELLEKFFILRIAWVFGKNGNNFVKTILKLSDTHDKLSVVCDQIGTPTYTYDLARLVVDMILSDKYGIYHVTNEGDYISWYDFTKAILEEAGVTSIEVSPVTSEEYGAAANRPKNSRMNRAKIREAGFEPLPDWRDALKRYIEVLKA